MSCGCSKKQAAMVPVATRAAMCLTCRHLPSDTGTKEPCPMTKSPLPLFQVIRRPEGGCHEGRWPDANGIVRWRGRQWLGAPDLIRWKFVLREGREPRAPGCGCDVKLKASRWGAWLDPWMRISGELRAKVAEALAGWKEMTRAIRGGRQELLSSVQGATYANR